MTGARRPVTTRISLREALDLVPPAVARAQRLVPLRRRGKTLILASARPADPPLAKVLRRLGLRHVALEVWPERQLNRLLSRHYGAAADLHELARRLGAAPQDESTPSLSAGQTPEEAPASRFVQTMLRAARIEGASDVHLDPGRQQPRLRFRLDGLLTDRPAPPAWLWPRLVGRLQALAGLEPGEALRPQDGAFEWQDPERQTPVEVRLSLLPTERGPACVLRLMSGEEDLPRLESLGLRPRAARMLRWIGDYPDGLIVVAGPTGAGKSTTLHALLGHESGQRNVVSIEDPVEIRRSSIRQVAVRPQAGLDFAGALRSILRQDPDVILVGETRDEETARLVVQAAAAGHLVLTSVHASTVLGAFDRLSQLGAERALLATSCRLIMSQRLLRRRCPRCGGAGCLPCNGEGYRGRVGVFELLPLTDLVRRRLRDWTPGSDPGPILSQATGYRSFQAGVQKLIERNLTTPAEVRRVLGDLAWQPNRRRRPKVRT